MYIFTICSNNYLAQAIVLGNSIRQANTSYRFTIFLVDEKHADIRYDEIPHEIIPVSQIEPDLHSLVIKYQIVELNTSIKPRVFEYLFEEKKAAKAIYLDPDIRVFTGFEELESIFENHSIVLTPHIYSPIPMDGETPQENLFLKYGIYNLGFLALKNAPQTIIFLRWWKQWTYRLGYNRAGSGIFVDQLPINHAPIFFEQVLMIRHYGYNMAPWNLH